MTTLRLLLLALPVSLFAGQAAADDNWVSLFNGESLDGWEQQNGSATYRVADGVIIGKTAVGSPNSFMCTKKHYGDFELTFEVNVDNGLNSGVQIRSHSKPEFKNGRVHGPQVEIESGPGEAGYVYSEGTGRGWLTENPRTHNVFQNGKWNKYRVVAKGARIQTWINGKAMEDLSDEKSSKSGFIGLQVHGIKKGSGPFEVRWRNIKIREL